jgi:hypothetical protein
LAYSEGSVLLEGVQELVKHLILGLLAHLHVGVVCGVERALDVVDFDVSVSVLVQPSERNRHYRFSTRIHITLQR